MTTIKANIGKEHYQTTLTARNHQLIADEPVENGGTDLGFSPSELFASALGTCTSVTLRMYADRKNFPLESVETIVTFERDQALNISRINREISLKGDLTDEQRERLLQIANQCFIHKTLSNPILINTGLQ